MQYQGFVYIFGGYRYCNKTDQSTRKQQFETCFYLLQKLILDVVSFADAFQGLQSTVHRNMSFYLKLMLLPPTPLTLLYVWGRRRGISFHRPASLYGLSRSTRLKVA
jgi:hypothetical protein